MAKKSDKKQKDPNEIRISAKALGDLNMPDFDPQVFWVKSRVKFRTPFGIFPGIFSTLDKYQKDITVLNRAYFGQWTPWVCADVERQEPCPHWSKFCYTDEETGIVVSGAIDDCFVKTDGTLMISDNKLSKITDTQDHLLPMYEAQLNGYAEIAERTGMGKVSQLQLVYHEPVTNLADADEFKKIFLENQYLLKFDPKVVEIKRDVELVPRLLKRAKEIIDMPTPPEPPDGKISKDLELVLQMAKALNDGMHSRKVDLPIEASPTRKSLRVLYNGKFVGGVSVPIDLDEAKIREAIIEDPLIQLYNSDAIAKPEGFTWESK